jgi:hypothetical protein
LGPAPTLPVNAPADALFGHRQHPRGHSITFRWMPDGCRALRTTRRAFCSYTGRIQIEPLIKSLDLLVTIG